MKIEERLEAAKVYAEMAKQRNKQECQCEECRMVRNARRVETILANMAQRKQH